MMIKNLSFLLSINSGVRMINYFFIISLLLPCVLLTGCMAPSRQPLTISDRNNIKSNQVIVDTAQREIDPVINGRQVSYYDSYINPQYDYRAMIVTTAGDILRDLIISAVDHYKIRAAEKEIAPIRNELVDFNYMPILTHQIRTKLEAIPCLKVSSTKLKYNLNDTEKNRIVQDKKQGTTLFVDSVYELNNKFDTLFVNTSVSLDQENKNTGERKTIFRNHYTTVDSLGKKLKSRNESISLWSSHHGERLKSGLTQSAQLIADMIAMDIQNPNKDLYKNMQSPVISFYNQQGDKLKAKLIKKAGDYFIVRTPTDALFAFNEKALVK